VASAATYGVPGGVFFWAIGPRSSELDLILSICDANYQTHSVQNGRNRVYCLYSAYPNQHGGYVGPMLSAVTDFS
jgi:hypothetical protein